MYRTRVTWVSLLKKKLFFFWEWFIGFIEYKVEMTDYHKLISSYMLSKSVWWRPVNTAVENKIPLQYGSLC